MAKYKPVSLTRSVEDILSNAASELQTVAEELAEWRDAIGERFSGTDKFSRISEAADMLQQAGDELDSIDVPEKYSSAQVTFIEMHARSRRQQRSRQVRADDAVSSVRAVVDELQVDDMPDELSDLIDELENVLGNIEGGIDIPGMYG